MKTHIDSIWINDNKIEFCLRWDEMNKNKSWFKNSKENKLFTDIFNNSSNALNTFNLKTTNQISLKKLLRLICLLINVVKPFHCAIEA